MTLSNFSSNQLTLFFRQSPSWPSLYMETGTISFPDPRLPKKQTTRLHKTFKGVLSIWIIFMQGRIRHSHTNMSQLLSGETLTHIHNHGQPIYIHTYTPAYTYTQTCYHIELSLYIVSHFQLPSFFLDIKLYKPLW